MATASERIDSAKVLNTLTDLKARIQQELEELNEEIGETTETLPEEPSLHQEKDIDQMMKTKMRLKSEIEAKLESSLLELPDDNQLMMRLAKEEAEMMANNNARTLAAYREKIKQLQEEKKKYENFVKKATLVHDKLDEVIKRRSEKDQLELLKRRYERAALVFRALRNELHHILTDFYSDDEESTSMEGLLDRLVTKMLQDQNDPYIDIVDHMRNDHIAFLLRANLIVRHDQNVSKIRFIDPRT